VTFLIDRNIISEISKPSCNRGVSSWYASIADDDIFLSVLVVGEIRKGVELIRSRDRGKADALDRWLGEISVSFGERILPVTRLIAEEWGQVAAIRSVPVIDGLLVATAIIRSLTLVTRNEADVTGLGAAVLNSFA
jgi:predicted nucleic acid-binding protein